MKLLVRKKDASGNKVTFFIEVSPTSTGAEISELVARQTKVPVEAQVITYSATDLAIGEQTVVILTAEVTVAEAGLAEHSVLNLEVNAQPTEESKTALDAAAKHMRGLGRDLQKFASRNWLAEFLETCASGSLVQVLQVLSEYERAEAMIEEQVEILSAAGPRGWTCLHVACLKGHAEITKFLVEHRASCNKETEDYWTPLQLASYNGHVECKG
jgi:hypothetical protein